MTAAKASLRNERLQKILSAHGVASRREAEEMIRAGRVTVNGAPAAIGQSAVYGRDVIEVDGAPLAPACTGIYIMLNKPRGYVTTLSDEQGRRTVISLIKEVDTRVYPVGRLDMNSEGLLLLTNDGRFANNVTHPSFMKRKTYEVHVRGDVDGSVSALRRPVTIDSRQVQADSVELIKRTKEGGVLSVAIHEGRNRQIRMMCAGCGLEVLSLKRVSIGMLELGTLKTGQWRYLTEEEVSYFG